MHERVRERFEWVLENDRRGAGILVLAGGGIGVDEDALRRALASLPRWELRVTGESFSSWAEHRYAEAVQSAKVPGQLSPPVVVLSWKTSGIHLQRELKAFDSIWKYPNLRLLPVVEDGHAPLGFWAPFRRRALDVLPSSPAVERIVDALRRGGDSSRVPPTELAGRLFHARKHLHSGEESTIGRIPDRQGVRDLFLRLDEGMASLFAYLHDHPAMEEIRSFEPPEPAGAAVVFKRPEPVLFVTPEGNGPLPDDVDAIPCRPSDLPEFLRGQSSRALVRCRGIRPADLLPIRDAVREFAPTRLPLFLLQQEPEGLDLPTWSSLASCGGAIFESACTEEEWTSLCTAAREGKIRPWAIALEDASSAAGDLLDRVPGPEGVRFEFWEAAVTQMGFLKSRLESLRKYL